MFWVRSQVLRPPPEADCGVEEPPGGRRQHVVVDAGAARAHAEQRHAAGVAAEAGDVLARPPWTEGHDDDTTWMESNWLLNWPQLTLSTPRGYFIGIQAD